MARKAPHQINYERLLAEVEGTSDDSVYGAVSRFLNRPGNAVRAALAGDLTAAGKNLGQMVLDFPTGGFLNRKWSLGNLASETGDITSSRERYTTERMLKSMGMDFPTGPAGVALNFAGDVATDPLSYVTLGGAGLAKGALTGAGKGVAASRLFGELMATSAGRAALKGVSLAERPAAIERMFGLAAGGLDKVDDAAEAAILAKGISKGMLRDPGALHVLGQPVVRDIWPRLGKATAPGLLRELGKRMAPEVTAKVDDAIRGAWDTTARALIDNTITGRLTKPGMRRGAQEGKVIASAKSWEGNNVARDIAAVGLPPERMQEVAKRMQQGSARYMAEAYGKRKPEREAIQALVQQEIEAGLSEPEVGVLRRAQEYFAKARKELREGKLWGRKGEYILDADGADLVAAHADAAAELAAARASGGEDAIKAARKAARKARRDLTDYEQAISILTERAPKNAKKAKALLKQRARRLMRKGMELQIEDPFYLPRQLKDEVAALMPRGAGLAQTKGFGSVKHAMLKRREYDTVEQWADAVGKAAARSGKGPAEVQEILDELPEAFRVEDVAELDIPNLILRYGDKHGMSMGRQHVLNEAHRLGIDIRKDNGAKEYIAGLWENTGRKSAAQRWVAKINSWFKPWATVVWPSYHARNAVSAIFQTALDPDLNMLDGVVAAARTFSDTPAAGLAAKLGIDPSDGVALMRAFDGDAQAIQHVMGLEIAGRPGADVLQGLVATRSQAGGGADLFESVTNAERLGRPIPKDKNPAVLEGWKRFGYAAANRVENSVRSHAYLKLVSEGVDPVDAVQRVNRAFVDYSLQSSADRLLRDLFPFARFQVAQTPVVAQALARQPGGLGMQVLRQGEAQSEQRPAEEQLGLPEYVRRGFRMPLGDGSYVPSLGLPQESAAQLVEGLTPFGRREAFRQLGAGLSPMLRVPVEWATDRNLYTGASWGANRKAPPLSEAFGIGQTYTTSEGKEYREVPGWVNELIRALPTSRFASVANQMAEEEKPWLEKLVKQVTGVGTVTVDQRRGAARAVAKHMSRLYAQGKVGEARQHWARLAEGERVPEGLREAIEAEASFRKRK